MMMYICEELAIFEKRSKKDPRTRVVAEFEEFARIVALLVSPKIPLKVPLNYSALLKLAQWEHGSGPMQVSRRQMEKSALFVLVCPMQSKSVDIIWKDWRRSLQVR